MKKAIRVAMVAAPLAAAALFLAPSTAQAQVRFEGRFRLPHGNIAIGVGDRYRGYYGSPYYPVGSYVPYGYRVSRRPRLGYGFYSRGFNCRSHRAYHSHWVPVRRYRTRWVVVERPVVVVQRPYDDGYYRGQYYPQDGYYRDQSYRQNDYRDQYYRQDVNYDGNYQVQGYSNDSYYNFNREFWDRSYHPYDNRCARPRGRR